MNNPMVDLAWRREVDLAIPLILLPVILYLATSLILKRPDAGKEASIAQELTRCPFCGGEMEYGYLASCLGIRWIPQTDLSSGQSCPGSKHGRVMVAAKCKLCEAGWYRVVNQESSSPLPHEICKRSKPVGAGPQRL
jgi:hypothetical protein